MSVNRLVGTSAVTVEFPLSPFEGAEGVGGGGNEERSWTSVDSRYIPCIALR